MATRVKDHERQETSHTSSSFHPLRTVGMFHAAIPYLIGLSLHTIHVRATADCSSFYQTLSCTSGNPSNLDVVSDQLYACTYNETIGSTNYTMAANPECTVTCLNSAQLVAYITDLSTQFFLSSARYDTTQWILTQSGSDAEVDWESDTDIEFTCIGGTTTTTVVSTTTMYVDAGRCGPYINGVGETLPNSCVTVDKNATCNDEGPDMCTCSAGYTGSNCGNTLADLALVAELAGGDNATAQQLLALLGEARSSPATLIDMLPSLYATLNESTRIEMSWSLDEMIDSIDYEREDINLEERMTFSYDPILGNCYTFNFANNTGSPCLHARIPGQNRDFSVQVKLNASEQAAWIEALAIQVYIAAPGTTFQNGVVYSLKAGAADMISLSKSITNMSENCIDGVANLPKGQNYYMGTQYTTDNCYNSCYQDAAYAKCGCMDAQFDHPTTVPDCLYNLTNCLTQLQSEMGDMSSWNCTCPQPCYQETYTLEATRAMLPFKIPPCDNETIGCPDMNQAMARLRIYMDTLETQQYVEVDKMTYSTFLSQVGGQLGFLLGMSIVGIIEIILLCCQLARGKDDEVKQAPPRRIQQQ